MAVFYEKLYEAAGCVFAASALRKWSKRKGWECLSGARQKEVLYNSAE